MTMSTVLQDFLSQRDISYDLLTHRHADTAVNSAMSAHVPVEKMAKAVVLEDEKGYVMAVVPARQHVRIGKLNKVLGRYLGLATESELPALFRDCEPGVAPPVGEAYGLDTVVDQKVLQQDDVYIEAGDHSELIHLTGDSFRKMMEHSRQADII